MNLKEKVIKIESIEELPTIEEIKSISRGLNLKVLFKKKTKTKREEIGEKWKTRLSGFSIGIHTIEDEINILKLITDEEIQQYQLFFENCAILYGKLAEQLINKFIKQFEVQSHEGFPLKTLNPYGKKVYSQNGGMGEWRYFFHGFHCAFTDKQTGQHIEVPLTYGEEYGELDPYFFVKFIKTTPKFKPLPVGIYNDFSDGKRILDVMLSLGKFEEINSNLKGKKGIIVENRVKKEVKIFDNGIEEILKNSYA